MPRRAALITQADVARTIRAVQATGVPIVRIVVRSDGIAIETALAPDPAPLIRNRVEDEDVMVL